MFYVFVSLLQISELESKGIILEYFSNIFSSLVFIDWYLESGYVLGLCQPFA